MKGHPKTRIAQNKSNNKHRNSILANKEATATTQEKASCDKKSQNIIIENKEKGRRL